MVGWHHRFNGHVFEQAPGDGEGQRSLTCSSPWGRKESAMTEQLNNHQFSDLEPFCQRVELMSHMVISFNF